jgi:5'-nucleotidase
MLLLSNDDGVHADGLKALADSLKDLDDLEVFAPDRNRSGASNSLSLMRPLRMQTMPNGFHSVQGTPTDCVHLALTGILQEQPKLVVSGINHDPNLGDDVWYSGTVAAAMEGRFCGIPSVAISLNGSKHFDTAAHVAYAVVGSLLNMTLTSHTILNINVPDVPYESLNGIAITRLGTRHIAEPTIRDKDPRGHEIFWIGPAGSEQDAGEGTDFHAMLHNQVSITPLRIDLTDQAQIETLQSWVKHIQL